MDLLTLFPKLCYTNIIYLQSVWSKLSRIWLQTIRPTKSSLLLLNKCTHLLWLQLIPRKVRQDIRCCQSNRLIRICFVLLTTQILKSLAREDNNLLRILKTSMHHLVRKIGIDICVNHLFHQRKKLIFKFLILVFLIGNQS